MLKMPIIANDILLSVKKKKLEEILNCMDILHRKITQLIVMNVNKKKRKVIVWSKEKMDKSIFVYKS